MRKLWAITLAVASISIIGCSGAKPTDSVNVRNNTKSMKQLYNANGRPVQVREIKRETFTINLKYPADFRARSQSTAYAKLSDIVREVKVKVGDHVGQDQVILVFSLDNSSYQQAKLAFENAEAVYTRIQALYKEAGVSKQDHDNARTQYEIARESYKAASDMVQVKAPISGTITQINVRPSQNVAPGAALFTISNQEGFEASFYVTAGEIDEIRAGAPATISYKNETISGRVTEVSLIMDPVKKAFPVKAFFAGRPRNIVSGMTVDISVEAYRNGRAIVVPRGEMLRSGDSWFVFVKNGDTAEKRPVTIGRVSGLDYEIKSGLETGDILVRDGVQDLADGDKILAVGQDEAGSAESK